MAISLNFYGAVDFSELINNGAGSGLGFYGSDGFSASVPVSNWQGRTYITNAAGSNQGAECNNVKYLSSPSGILGQTSSGTPLLNIPNAQSTLKISLESDSAVQVQNAKLRIYDRSDVDKAATGVTCAVAEIIHPSILQTVEGSGDSDWIFPEGSAVILDLGPSPGQDGLYNNGVGGRTDTRHDWYVALSASPDSVGSKTQFGLYVSLEYF